MIRITRIIFIAIISIFLNLWILMSRHMNQIYFEGYEFDVKVVTETCTYKSMLNWIQMNQSSWISILLSHLYSKLHEYLWVAKKRFIADLWCIRTRTYRKYISCQTNIHSMRYEKNKNCARVNRADWWYDITDII